MKTIQKIIVVTLMSLLSFHDSLVYATEHIIAKSQKYTEFQCVRFNPSYWEPSKTYTYDEKGPMAYLRIDNGLVEIHIPAIGDLPTMDFKGPYLSLEDEKRFSIDHYLVLGGYHGPISGKPSYFGWEYSYDTSPRCVNSYEICGDGRLIYEDGEYISEYIASVTIGLGAYKDRPSLKLYKRNKGQPTNQTETTDAETDPGEDEGVGILDSIIKGITPAVIAAVLGGLAVVGIAIGAAASRRRKRKTRKQSQAQDTQNISYNMYVSKDFGDAIRRGAAPVRVYARIAKVVNETEYDWPQLTQMIQCSGEGLSVRPLGMVGNKMCAEVQAGNDNQSSQGTVKFVLSSPTGVFQRRVVFRLVDGPRIVFPGETADGKAWDLNEDNSTVVSIAGVRSFQKLRFVIVDAVSDPTEIRFSPPGDIIVRHTPDDKQRFAYYAYIENNTKPAVKEAEVFADKQEIEIPIEAYFANGDVARSYFTVELYPEGLSVLISGGPNPLRPKTPGARQVLVNGRLEVVSYATREKGELTLDPVITPTGFDLCYAYLEKGKPVVVTEPRYFELQPLKEESENTRGILEKYHYQRGWYISGFALRPSDSIPELESPYHVKMFVIATVGEMTDWMDVPIRLLGEPFSPMKAWEEEFRGLCEAVLRYYPAEVAHREIAYIRENFSDPEVWDKSKLRIIRYETIGRAQQFWLNQYGYEMQLVSYYDLTEAVFKKPTRFIGDTAFKIVARFYWGENESWITPLKDLFVDVVDEAFWNYAFTGDASVDVVEKIMDQWMENVSTEERRIFTDSLFDALGKDGSETLFDVLQKGPAAIENMIVSLLGADPAAKETIKKLPEAAIAQERKAADKVTVLFKKEIAHQPFLLDGIIALFGILLLLLPANFFNLVMGVSLFLLFAAETAFTVRRLIRNHWNARSERTRIILCIVLLVIFLLILVKEQALFVLSSALFGGILLFYAYYTASKLKQDRRFGLFYWLHLAEAVIFALCGLFILIAPQWAIRWYAVSVGVILILDAATHALFRLLKIKNET